MNTTTKNEKPNELISNTGTEKLSVERNISEMASFIFAAPYKRPDGKQDARPRAKTWTFLDKQTNRKYLAKIVVNEVNGEILTPTDYRTYLALQKIWWERPQNDDGTISFQFRELARIMQIKWGGETHRTLKESLLRLSHISIDWRFAFYSQSDNGYVNRTRPMQILDELDMYEVFKGHPDAPEVIADVQAGTGVSLDADATMSRFRFDKEIEQNLFKEYNRTVLLDVAMSIPSGHPLTFYAFLDVIMAGKRVWERRLTGLLYEDLVITGSYPHPSDRKRLLERWIKEVNGKAISTGTLDIKIDKTNDGEDYKLIVKKRPFAKRQKRTISPDLIDRIIEVTEDPESKGYYLKAVRALGEEKILNILADTQVAHREHRIKTSKKQYFTDLTQRYMGNKPFGR